MNVRIILYALVFGILGCSQINKKTTCTQENYSPEGCQQQRASAQRLTFFATTIYFPTGSTTYSNQENLDEVVRFQKLYNANIHLIAYQTNVSKQRLTNLISFFENKNIPANKLYTKTTSTPIYRNGKKNTQLSERVEIYLEY
ncbi:MAG: hypothetical protein JXR30_01925 [Alphaproteobacteria bacterium]|nr:hypothetical protein [Alphaproteobacteria bacterium]